jgi:hypothetical protein
MKEETGGDREETGDGFVSPFPQKTGDRTVSCLLEIS